MTFFLSLLESFPCGLLVHKGNQDKIRLQREYMSNICQIKFALQTSGDKKKTLFYPFWTAWLIISNLQLQEISLIRYICCRKDATNQKEDTHYWAIPLKLDHFTDYDMTQTQLQTDKVQVLAWPDADACGRASRRSLHFYPSELVKTTSSLYYWGLQLHPPYMDEVRVAVVVSLRCTVLWWGFRVIVRHGVWRNVRLYDY